MKDFDDIEEIDFNWDDIDSEDEVVDSIAEAIKLKKFLADKIYGQDMAIDAILDSVKNKIVDSIDGPMHTFLFLGPPATGKTYLAELIAEGFGNSYSFLELNMTEYQSHNDGMKIFGTERGWGTESNGVLTTFVKENPKTVILLDEFEKAHTNIQKKLLSLFSRGYLNDALGWMPDGSSYNSNDNDHEISKITSKVDFTQTIIVITSNLGSQIYNSHQFLDVLESDYDKAETMIMQSLLTETKREANELVPAIIPEMISRLSQGKTALFKNLKFEHLLKIADKVFEEQSKVLSNKLNISIDSFDKKEVNKDLALQIMLLKFAPFMDVRRIKSKMYENFMDMITDYMIYNDKTWSDIDKVIISVSANAEEFMKNEIEKNIEKGTLLKYLLRKNLTISYDYNISVEGKVFKFEISKVDYNKVTKVEDTLGAGALIFDIPETSFDDISGHIGLKSRLKEIANLLKNPSGLKKFGAKIPKGMLLHGVPGTGKTMLAKAFANYANLPFIETTANDLIDPGSGNLDLMKTVFNRARDYAPSIIFIDEIDTFGSRKDGGSKAVINEFLTQTNGFSEESVDESVFIIAATNLKSEIDEAILRPGRIELHVEVPTLDREGREYFIKKTLEKPSDKKIDIKKLVMYSAGMTGAQLEKVANESSLYALRHGLDKLTEKIIIEQINIEKYGNRVANRKIEDMLGETAYHEAGHAILSKVLSPEIKIEQVTVIPREGSLGFVSYNIEDSNSNPSKKDIENKICVAFAGRVAQMREYGEDGLDSGASSDLAHATRMAFYSVAHLGMNEELGYLNIDGIPNFQYRKTGISDNDIFNEDIKQHVQEMLAKLKTQTENLVDTHWDKINKLAKLLLEKEVVYEKDLEEIMN